MSVNSPRISEDSLATIAHPIQIYVELIVLVTCFVALISACLCLKYKELREKCKELELTNRKLSKENYQLA